ncbi:MAG: AI-2E family transporter, partial [Bacteroidetes bacterium]|nr:AI-2E family transporter [Bacteroidota bacterium]
MNISFNDRLKQLLLLALIVFLAFVLLHQLRLFIPGMLGAVTLYILSRNLYFQLIYHRKWKKGLTALLFILGYLVIIAIPVYASIKMVAPKINAMLENQEQIKNSIQLISVKVSELTGFELLSDETSQDLTKQISSFIPG